MSHPEVPSLEAPAPLRAVPRVPKVDAFRGLAILLVLLYHANMNIIMQGGWGLERGADGSAHFALGRALFLKLLLVPLQMGRVGVNLFFVISGLCIHMRLAKDRAANRQAPFNIRAFLGRRFFRIYPSYWAALAIGVLVVPPAFAALSGGESWMTFPRPTSADIWSHLFMLHVFSKTTFMSILPPMWSIATEEQFYLLYPLVFVLLGRRLSIGKTVLGLLALSLVLRVSLVFSNPPARSFSDGPFLVWLFGFSLSRYYEWSLGALLAWAVASGRTLELTPAPVFRFLGQRPRLVTVLGLGLILLGGASLLQVRLKWLIEDPCYSTGWFLIMAAAMLPATGPARAPRSPSAASHWIQLALQALGRRSFTVYLLHEVAFMATAYAGHRFHLPVVAQLGLAAAAVAAICGPFYMFVEAPTERFSRQIGMTKPMLAARPTIAD